MGNKRSRAWALQQEHDADWERIRTETRPAERDVIAHGIGLLRLQLIVSPSFDDARAWEVRQREQEWWLFRPRVVAPGPAASLVGYDPVPFEPERLEAFFRRVTALTLPIGPDLSGYAGADGIRYQLAVFGDLYSACRFRWWSRWPSHWQPLVDIADEMIKSFSAAGRPDGEPTAAPDRSP